MESATMDWKGNLKGTQLVELGSRHPAYIPLSTPQTSDIALPELKTGVIILTLGWRPQGKFPSSPNSRQPLELTR